MSYPVTPPPVFALPRCPPRAGTAVGRVTEGARPALRLMIVKGWWRYHAINPSQLENPS